MKGILGGIMFVIGLCALIGYTHRTDTSEWIVLLIILLISFGFDMAVEGMIDTRIEKLRDELRDEFENNN